MEKSQINAGFGRGELRFPPEMFPMEGFVGVHDAPCARVMVLEAGGVRATIAALELVNVPPQGIELCQSAIEEKTGTPRERIWIHVTHPVSTMHDPGAMGPPDRRPPESDEDRAKKQLYYQAMEQVVTEAAQQAADSFGPARLGWGTSRCEVNCSRDVEPPFGWWVGLNPDGVAKGLEIVERLGAEMGRDAIAIAEGIQCGENEGELRHRTASFLWKVRKEELRDMAGQEDA